MACEYCGNDSILGTSGCSLDGVEAALDGDKLAVSGWYDSFALITPLYIPINYCPMCGKKLGGNDDQ